MRRLIVIVGFVLALVGCTAPPAQGGAGSSAPPAAPPTQDYGDGY
jgi:hypothetical protein